jgi:hypothetical protein
MKLTKEYIESLSPKIHYIRATVTDVIYLKDTYNNGTCIKLLAGTKLNLHMLYDTYRQKARLDNLVTYTNENVDICGWIDEYDYDKLEIELPIDRTRALKLFENTSDDDFINKIYMDLQCKDCILRKTCESLNNGCCATLESYLRGEING